VSGITYTLAKTQAKEYRAAGVCSGEGDTQQCCEQ
jgi:hypothetical protein